MRINERKNYSFNNTFCNDNQNKSNNNIISKKKRKEYGTTALEKARKSLEYLRDKLQSDAWKNFFDVIDCRAKITDVISNSKSYKLNNDDYIKENGLNNGIRMNVTNEAGRKMDICVRRKTNGQWLRDSQVFYL